MGRSHRGLSPEGPWDELTSGARRFERRRPPGEIVEHDVQADARHGVERLAVLVERRRHEWDHDAVAQRYGLGLDGDVGEMLDRPDPGPDAAAVGDRGDWLVPESERDKDAVDGVLQDPGKAVVVLGVTTM